MLGACFLTIDGVGIPNPVSFSESYESVENVNQSEAGTDVVSVVRLGKLVLDCTWNASSFLKHKLENYSTINSVTVRYNGITRHMRMRDYSASLKEGSARSIESSNGLWSVSATLTEI